MEKTIKILLIGGGTGGHIFPLRNLTDELKKKGATVELVVSDSDLDKKIVKENFSDIKSHFFRTGKIRRYLSFQNFVDVFKIIKSIWTAKKILKKLKPNVLFFKGGFVGFPFLIAAKFLMRFKGRIFSHESDISAGVMTRFSRKFSDNVFESFSPHSPLPLFFEPEQHNYANRSNSSIPEILIFGGSQGAEFVNTLLLHCHDIVMTKYKVILITGPNKQVNLTHPHFKQFEFLPANKLSKLIHQSDLVISRAGANSLFEIISAKIPSIIIPLPSVARNHQMLNAQFFEKQGLCKILKQDYQAKNKFVSLIEEVLHDQPMKEALKNSKITNGAKEIVEKMI